MKIKKGDTVLIIKGKDRGKVGEVIKEIVEIPAPLYVSKVKLICPSCKKPTKVGYKFVDDIKKRYCKKCKNLID
jgi:large subunit ribosomal protein L24